MTNNSRGHETEKDRPYNPCVAHFALLPSPRCAFDLRSRSLKLRQWTRLINFYFTFPMGSFELWGRRTEGVVVTNDCGMKCRADCGLLRTGSQEVLPVVLPVGSSKVVKIGKRGSACRFRSRVARTISLVDGAQVFGIQKSSPGRFPVLYCRHGEL